MQMTWPGAEHNVMYKLPECKSHTSVSVPFSFCARAVLYGIALPVLPPAYPGHRYCL